MDMDIAVIIVCAEKITVVHQACLHAFSVFDRSVLSGSRLQTVSSGIKAA